MNGSHDYTGICKLSCNWKVKSTQYLKIKSGDLQFVLTDLLLKTLSSLTIQMVWSSPILLADDSTLKCFPKQADFIFLCGIRCFAYFTLILWLCKFWDSSMGQSFSFFARRCILHAHSILKPVQETGYPLQI